MNLLHAYVSGRVQGVYFRGWTRGHAQRLGLHGWVRNLRDGRVEVLASGPDNALRELQELLYEGPALSRVDGVEIVAMADEEQPTHGFSIAPTV
ncbi:acylphosphatase [Desulfonatronum thioautotrophicum]|uniref:acylphosphatase n=1 Tax=Desulfonatronum thioautotrophicum TaxID=617001 RepID=UPI0005EBEE61|nr:acylphosphatase [Desulfonatronum thioautotrophicum]